MTADAYWGVAMLAYIAVGMFFLYDLPAPPSRHGLPGFEKDRREDAKRRRQDRLGMAWFVGLWLMIGAWVMFGRG